MIGQKWGRWHVVANEGTVVGLTHKFRAIKWRCRCIECNHETIMTTREVKSNEPRHCRCEMSGQPPTDAEYERDQQAINRSRKHMDADWNTLHNWTGKV